MEDSFLIVGLGNPGREYAGTRHNIGFMTLERLAKRLALDWQVNKKFTAHLAKGSHGGNTALLCKPQGYMNVSGKTVAPLARYYQIQAKQVMVVLDDLDLPLGTQRMRPGGGTGGHRGVESIKDCLGTGDFPRLRLGIGRPAPERDVSGFVLGKFAENESSPLEKVLERAADQLECWMNQGLQAAMNNFNGDLSPPKKKKTDDEIRRNDHPEGNRA